MAKELKYKQKEKMKLILIILFAITLIGCSSIQNPRLSLGKKCIEDDTHVSYSYVWLYDKEDGLPASKDQC